ncbi:guanylate kinase [uncultured Desulfobacter sp.]|uniref:guanylate kinase n=1 Tax=uncultured Desulfobacter sp. TaxID=240139 RepID=UPI002AAA856C|nr:guanylate kinase [uncultured Desulfobacter sp.]
MAAKLFIFSAPSGTGKTTLVKELLGRFETLVFSISHTTRKPRPGEVHGKDYFFTDKAQFMDMVASGQMLEWAQVHDNCYGTSKIFVQEQLAAGKSVLLDIDVQGGRQIMDSGLKPVSVFIMPPSLEVLEQRLRGRGTDAEDVILRRLENAETEMAQKAFYTHVVVNDVLADAVAELIAIVEQETSN